MKKYLFLVILVLIWITSYFLFPHYSKYDLYKGSMDEKFLKFDFCDYFIEKWNVYFVHWDQLKAFHGLEPEIIEWMDKSSFNIDTKVNT